MPASASPTSSGTDTQQGLPFKKVRIHKVKGKRPTADSGYDDLLDRRIAEIVPGLADLSLADTKAMTTESRKTAKDVREAFNRKFESVQRQQRKEAQIIAENLELKEIFDFTKPHPVDNLPPPEGWVQKQRPTPKKVRLSWYQQNMVQYLRFLQSKNIWYYRDRMNVARGPCPAHVLRECWVHGVIDENTLVWGQGLFDWLPVKNVKLLIPTIRTVEVQIGAWLKKTLSLKPALNFMRKERANERNPDAYTSQVDRMY